MLTNSVTTQQLETAIARIDERLASESPALELRIDRAQFFEMLGRKDEAVQAYIGVLRLEPTHVDALGALGLMFLSAGNRAAARTLLGGAVLHGPAHAAAHANLAAVCVLDNRLPAARTLYERALQLDPHLAAAHRGLAELSARLGDDAAAEEHRVLGFRYGPIQIERYIGEGRPIHILGLGTIALGNVPTFGFFDNRTFLLASMAVEYADPTLPLPPHDIVFNVIGEADLCTETLATAAAIVARTDAPVINHPAAVAATRRADNAERVRRLEGVVAPRIVRLPRESLTGEAGAATLREHGFAYPLLVRSPGYHTGDHFVKVDAAVDLNDAVGALPGDDLFVIEYLDVRGSGDTYRKYRVMFVDGNLYPLHLAISGHWKVHYFSADMVEQADHRAADAAFLADMHGVLGSRAVAALERVRDTLALDCGGIDFAIDPNGDAIVFEANASMIVPTPGPDAIWDYRREPVARIRRAVREMLVRRATSHIAARAASSSATVPRQ
jgi:hypothetical protein